MSRKYNSHNKYSTYNDYNNGSNAYKYDYEIQYDDYNRRKAVNGKAVANKKKRENAMTPFVAFKLFVGCALIVLSPCAFIGFQTDKATWASKLTEKENYYNKLVRENDDLKNELIKNVDFKEIKKKAKKLGLKNAKGKNIKYYSMHEEEFLFQLEEFPNR